MTPQLLFVVNRVARTIAENTDAWTTVKVKGHHFSVVYYYSFLKRMKVLVYGKYKEYDPANICPGGAFGFKFPINHGFLFDGDLMSPATTASREEYLILTNNMRGVVKAFAVNQEKIYYKLLDAFEHLRHLVGST